MRLTRRRILLLATVTGLVVGGIAIGAWNTSGSGNGYGKARTSAALTLGDATASASADLYPGGTGDVQIKVTNPNAFPVRITQVTQTASSAITSDKGAACNNATGVTFTAPSSVSLLLGAGATATFTLSNALSMSNASDNACQGAVFAIPVDVTAVSGP